MNERECKNLVEEMGSNIVQHAAEFWSLFSAIQTIGPKKILEIGSASGGTLRFWQIICGQDGQSYGVDGGGKIRVDMSGYPEPILIKGVSQVTETIDQVAEYAPFDFCFIDADHTYEGCKKDWENYSPMVKPGGHVGFHDYGHPPVKRVVDEITIGTKQTWNSWAGIVLIKLPG